MKTILAASLLLALTSSAACIDQDDATDDIDGPGGKSDDSDAVDRYAVESTFDLGDSAPGVAVASEITALTANPQAPAKWLLGRMIAAENGAIGTYMQGSQQLLVIKLTVMIDKWGPTFRTTLPKLGTYVDQVSRNVTTLETLDVTASGKATRTITGTKVTLDGVATEHVVEATATKDVDVTIGDGKLMIAKHDLSLPYGAMLRAGIDGAIVPTLDTHAENLTQFLAHQVDCEKVAGYIVDQLEAGDEMAMTATCTAALTAYANELYTKVDGTGAAKLSVAGASDARDSNNDRAIDTLANGTWTGEMVSGTFHGDRK